MRLNTQLEAHGAELLVLGNLLRRRIQSFITSQNFEDYDIVATNPEKNKSLKIQVKSRFYINSKTFPISKFGSEFVVVAIMNCGKRKDGKTAYDYCKDPEFYIIPTELCKKYNRQGSWNKVSLKDIPDYKQYKNNWDLIKNKLEIKNAPRVVKEE